MALTKGQRVRIHVSNPRANLYWRGHLSKILSKEGVFIKLSPNGNYKIHLGELGTFFFYPQDISPIGRWR